MYRIILKTTDGRKHNFVNVTGVENDGKILSITYLVSGKEWNRHYNWDSIEYYNITEEE